jgi:hypothetical protein
MTNMTRHLRLTPVLLLAVLLAGCEGPCQKLTAISAPPTGSGDADFTRFAAVGTTISAGYQSGGLVDRHQVLAYPALFALQTGKTVQLDGKGTFSQPTVNGNGLAPLLQLRSLSPLDISNSGLAPGTPTNTTHPTPYSDLAIPGAIVYDFANTTNYAAGAFPLVARGSTSIQNQLLSLNPTFLSFEFGLTEILGPATSGSAVAPAGVPPANWAAVASPAAYSALLGGALGAIHAAVPNAKLALANVPDVTRFPFFRTFPPLTKDVRNGAYRGLVGWVHRDSFFTHGAPAVTDTFHIRKVDSLTANECIMITAKPLLAAGVGFKPFTYNYLTNTVNGTGVPLDSAVVLDEGEQAVLAGRLASMNAAIDAQAASAWIAKVDLNGLFGSFASGPTIIGGTKYTSAFVSGGLFSLDGVHPTDIAHAIIANTMIDAVNARFASTVPHVVVANYATGSSSSARHAGSGNDALGGIRIAGLEEAMRALYAR